MKIMRKLLTICLLILGTSTFGQDISGCETVSLEGEANIKASEPCIIKLSDYALSQPMIGSSDEAHHARKVVIAWIEATPDYTFSLNSEIMKVFKEENLLLFNIYLCCLANASLTVESDYHKAAIGLITKYVKDPSHKVVQSKQVKKLIKNWEDGNVEKYLN
jgi:hypothetical protein